MATAPRPGVAKRAEATDDAKTIARLTVKGVPHTLAVANLPTLDKLLVRKATGIPYEQFLAGEEKVGEDTVVIWWWLARRHAGEIQLTFARACDEWDELEIGPDDLEVELVEPDGDDPEA